MFRNLFHSRRQQERYSHIALFEKLEQLLAEAVALANSNITDQLLKVQIRQQTVSPDNRASERRCLLANAERALSIKAVPGHIDIYLMPASQALLIPESEYPSRIKFKLEESLIDDVSVWKLDDAEIDDSILRLVLLASVNDLLREVRSFERNELKLSVGEVSLSSAVRDLITDRNRLSSLLIQEQERVYRKLSMDLHDDVLGDLMVLYRDLDGKQIEPEEIKTDLQAVMQKLRRLCNELSSSEVDDWGLCDAVTELCQRVATRNGITINLAGIGELPELPVAVNLQIYRIIQECLNNAVKHSGGSTVNVSVRMRGSEAKIETVSTGSKHPFNVSADQSKLGLRIMSERAEIISSLGYPASMEVESDPITGWVITLFVDVSRGLPQLPPETI